MSFVSQVYGMCNRLLMAANILLNGEKRAEDKPHYLHRDENMDKPFYHWRVGFTRVRDCKCCIRRRESNRLIENFRREGMHWSWYRMERLIYKRKYRWNSDNVPAYPRHRERGLYHDCGERVCPLYKYILTIPKRHSKRASIQSKYSVTIKKICCSGNNLIRNCNILS